jgi:RimJ/RimL family protein N-acetyltransferase
MPADFDWGPQLPSLATPRFVLRWLTPNDVPALFEVFSDPQVMRYWSSPPLQRTEQAAELLAEIERFFHARTLFQWGIAAREDDHVVGTCTLYHLNLDHRRGEIGFALGRAHWRRGIMGEALSALIAFAFGALDLHRLEADVDPRNEPSIRALERQGFRYEGLMRQRYHLNAEIQDAAFYGLLRPEWRGGNRDAAIVKA